MAAMRKLVDAILHPNGDSGAAHYEETPGEVLDALEWTERDTGEDLVERAEKLENAEAPSP